ncbi:hypothetical protein C8R47DRAFT_1012805 [Mycena vitilis]|nr:hypothetical protein C8R47DRAFT_1012805 [Mycena vitilis]
MDGNLSKKTIKKDVRWERRAHQLNFVRRLEHFSTKAMVSKTLLRFGLASFAAVKAVDLCAYSSTEGCAGSALCCFDAAEHLCCNELTAEYGFSIGYAGLPGPVSDGQAWTGGNCADGPVFTGESGTGDKCFVGGKTNSMSWTNTAGKRANPGPNATAQPNVFKFTANGVEKAVKIPTGKGAVDAVIALYKAGNFTGLATYVSAE